MPFHATDPDDDIVLAADADAETEYRCPMCGDPLRIRSGHKRDSTWVSRHFYHQRDGAAAGCPGGESDTHRRMKSIAISKARRKWPNATVEHEAGIGNRQADVRVDLASPEFPLGRGVGIECQYRHKDKDIAGVESDYARNGYGTLWLYEDDFTDKNVDLDAGSLTPAWPLCVPDKDEWTDHHGVIHWLRNSKPTDLGDFEVRIPHDPGRMNERWSLRDAWVDGRTQPVYGPDDHTILQFDCLHCEDEEVELRIPTSIERKPNDDHRGNIVFHLDETNPGECSSCGSQNTLYKRNKYPKVAFQASKRTLRTRDHSDHSIDATITCLNCNAFVEYILSPGSFSSQRPTSSYVKLGNIYCPHCDTSFRALDSIAGMGLFD